MRITPIKTNFNAGELSPKLEGRTDIAKYANGCKQMQNMLPLVQGCVTRRGGTKFVAEVKSSATAVWLQPFVFNYVQSFVLEFGVGYLRFFTNRGQLTVSAADWDNGTSYEVGDTAVSGGVTYYCKVAHSGQMPPNTTYWYALTNAILELPTSFTADMLTNSDGTCGLSMVQSGDVIYICTRDNPPQKLSRYSNSKWVIETIDFSYGPFQDLNTDDTNEVYTDAQTGTVTVTATDTGTFSDVDVGGLFMLYQNIDDTTEPWEPSKSIATNDIRNNDGKNYKSLNTTTTGYVPPIHTIGSQCDGDAGVQWEYQNPTFGILKKTVDISGGQTMTATVIHQIPVGAVGSGNASWVWAKAAWSTTEGYPTHVTFFRQRLVFARDRTIWFSVIADYENFATAEFNQVLPESAITLNIDNSDTSQITYLSATKQGLVVGTSSGEMIITEASINDIFGANNVKVSPSTGYGSRSIKPIRIDDSVVFVQRGGIKLRNSQYDFQADNFKASDLNVLSDHITLGGIIDMTLQVSPYNIIWMVRADGVLVGFTYNQTQDVIAWHRHIIGGSFSTGDAVVERVLSIPSPDGLRDDLWLVIKRTVNGSTVRYVEYMVAEFEDGNDREDAFYVDSGLTYDGVAADMISGLDHLIGQTVKVLADGSVHPDCVVDNSGEITLNYDASVVHVGLDYTPLIQTMRVDGGSANGSAQGKIKRISSVVVRTLNSLGVLVSVDGTTYEHLSFRSAADLMDTAVPLVTGDREVTFTGADTDGYIYIKQDSPLPMTILAIIPQVTVYDKG